MNLVIFDFCSAKGIKILETKEIIKKKNLFLCLVSLPSCKSDLRYRLNSVLSLKVQD